VVSAHRAGLSVRKIAAAVGLGPTRVHQLLRSPEAATWERRLGLLRLHGWPAPEDPPPDAPSGDRIGDRLADEAQALRDVIDWLDQLVRTGMPEVLELRPRSDFPLHYRVLASHERIVRIVQRIASDIDELARARRVQDLSTEAVDADPRLRIRRRLAEPPIEIPRHGSSNKQWREAIEWFEDEHRKAGLPLPWKGESPLKWVRRS
jgi:AcrR family transcriptional regulator